MARAGRVEMINRVRSRHRATRPARWKRTSLDARRSDSSRARRRRVANGRAYARAAGEHAGTTSGPVPAVPRTLTRAGRALDLIRHRQPDRWTVSAGLCDQKADGVRDHAICASRRATRWAFRRRAWVDGRRVGRIRHTGINDRGQHGACGSCRGGRTFLLVLVGTVVSIAAVYHAYDGGRL